MGIFSRFHDLLKAHQFCILFLFCSYVLPVCIVHGEFLHDAPRCCSMVACDRRGRVLAAIAAPVPQCTATHLARCHYRKSETPACLSDQQGYTTCIFIDARIAPLLKKKTQIRTLALRSAAQRHTTPQDKHTPQDIHTPCHTTLQDKHTPRHTTLQDKHTPCHTTPQDKHTPRHTTPQDKHTRHYTTGQTHTAPHYTTLHYTTGQTHTAPKNTRRVHYTTGQTHMAPHYTTGKPTLHHTTSIHPGQHTPCHTTPQDNTHRVILSRTHHLCSKTVVAVFCLFQNCPLRIACCKMLVMHRVRYLRGRSIMIAVSVRIWYTGDVLCGGGGAWSPHRKWSQRKRLQDSGRKWGQYC